MINGFDAKATCGGSGIKVDNSNIKLVKGDKGDRGEAGYTPYIGSNGNWWINGEDTGYKAKGDKGDKGDTYSITESDYQAIADRVPIKVDDVQVNGTSIVTDGVANIPIGQNRLGLIKAQGNAFGLNNDGTPYASSYMYSQYVNAGGNLFIGKNTLENVLAERLKEPQFELIEEITLTEDVAQIDRRAEPDGTPYNFKKILIMGTTKASASAGVLRVECGVTTYVTNGLYTVDRAVQAEFEVNDAGRVYGMCNSGNAQILSYMNRLREGSKLTRLNIRPDTSGRVIPNGSTYSIYGIRA